MNDTQFLFLFILIGVSGLILCALIESNTNRIIDEIKRLRERER